MNAAHVPHTVLVVEDDEITRRAARALLERQGHTVLECEHGSSALIIAFTSKPDCILLDLGLPDIDGLEVLRRLRAHVFTRHLPVIVVTAYGHVQDRVDALEAGADDYVVKPFDSRELLARIEAVLRRARENLSADPLTKLPGNVAVREEVADRLKSDEPFAAAYADLDNFKVYVDTYGFERASQVIQFTGKLLYNALIDRGEPDDLIGHIGGDDFLFVGALETAERISEALVADFAVEAPHFYGQVDRQRGFVMGKDRVGNEHEFPLVSLSVAVVFVPIDVERPDVEHLAAFAARCKTHVKSLGGGRWRRYVWPTEPGAEPRARGDATGAAE